MQQYYFDTLLFFFQAQKQMNYEAIETIVGILEDEELPDEDKRDGILYMLRKYGLNETTVKDGRFEPKESNWKFPPHLLDDLDNNDYHQCQVTQLISVKMLNGGLLFEVCLN